MLTVDLDEGDLDRDDDTDLTAGTITLDEQALADLGLDGTDGPAGAAADAGDSARRALPVSDALPRLR